MKERYKCLGLILLVLAGTLMSAGCGRYPQDPRQTLEDVLTRGTLRVGVMENSPWVTGRPSSRPGGLEGNLLADFAEQLGVRPEWHWGPSEEHFEALSRYELDVVIGGITNENPWRTHVGFTFPYYSSQVLVGVPTSGSMISDLDGITVAVHDGSGLQDLLKNRGARVVVREDFTSVQTPVAAEAWEIEGVGLRPTNIRLRNHQHVIAVPPGENALLMRLEEFLLRQTTRQRMADQLWEAASR